MRCPFAVWRGSPNHGSGGISPIGLILHVIVGTLEAADSVFHNSSSSASAHFGVGKDGTLWQWVDTADKAWAEGAGNSSYWSVETEGYPNEALTDLQCQKIAQLYDWLRGIVAIPFVLANTPGEHGFGTHSMGGAAWGGHACPGDIRAAQRQHILDLAQGLGDDDMTPDQAAQLQQAHDAVARMEKALGLVLNAVADIQSRTGNVVQPDVEAIKKKVGA